MRPFGRPDYVDYDPGGANLSTVMTEGFTFDNTVPCPCAGQAHWQIGVAERHGAVLERKFTELLQTHWASMHGRMCKLRADPTQNVG